MISIAHKELICVGASPNQYILFFIKVEWKLANNQPPHPY